MCGRGMGRIGVGPWRYRSSLLGKQLASGGGCEGGGGGGALVVVLAV